MNAASNEPRYTLYADRPVYRRVPWWAVAAGVLAVAFLVFRRRGARRGYEDYLA